MKVKAGPKSIIIDTLSFSLSYVAGRENISLTVALMLRAMTGSAK